MTPIVLSDALFRAIAEFLGLSVPLFGITDVSQGHKKSPLRGLRAVLSGCLAGQGHSLLRIHDGDLELADIVGRAVEHDHEGSAGAGQQGHIGPLLFLGVGQTAGHGFLVQYGELQGGQLVAGGLTI